MTFDAGLPGQAVAGRLQLYPALHYQEDKNKGAQPYSGAPLKLSLGLKELDLAQGKATGIPAPLRDGRGAKLFHRHTPRPRGMEAMQ